MRSSTRSETSRKSSGLDCEDVEKNAAFRPDEHLTPNAPIQRHDIDSKERREEPLPATETANERSDIVAKEDYSVFTVNQKRAMIFTASFAGWFSPMTGSIYYPALNEIAADLKVSVSQVNITVTTYLIIQGVAPMMIAGFSDKAGRKPAYFICFTVYIIANLALALQNSYSALLVLRMLQSAGSSGTVTLANGLVGDCVVSADRGQYIAFSSLGSILGLSVGPIIGGLLSQYLDWHWIFWFLLILSGAFFIPLMLFLPETCRNVVGDGSIPPPWTSWNISDSIRFKRLAARGITVNEEKRSELRKNYKLSIPNPMSTLVILTDLESALILLVTGISMACFYGVSTGASDVFSTIYNFNELEIALMFLPIGAGTLLSAFTTGKLLDYNYRRHAHHLSFPLHKNRQTDLSTFPIELARIQIALPVLLLGAAIFTAYGWMMTHKIPLAGPVIMLFLMGYTLNSAFQVLNVLIMDLWPGKPATASAATNLVRCLLGAGASAAIAPMSQAMGYGWAYTTLAAIFLVSSVAPVVCVKYGMRWRRERREREEMKRKEREMVLRTQQEELTKP